MAKFITVLVNGVPAILNADVFSVQKGSNTTVVVTSLQGVKATFTHTSDTTTNTANAFVEAVTLASSVKSAPDAAVTVALPTGKTVSALAFSLVA